MLRTTFLSLGLACSIHCGDVSTIDDGGVDAADDAETVAIPEGYEELVAGSWELAPGTEGYFCVYVRVNETMYVDGFHALTPRGTHHSLLTVLPETTVIDSTVRCVATQVSDRVIYGAGVGTETLELPDGVATKLEAGQQLLLNLHVFNSTSRVLRGTSGVYGRLADAEVVVHEADARLVGPTAFSIPARTEDYRVSGTCTLPAEQTIFALAPHMHWFGTYLKATAVRGGERTILFEGSYSFDDQRYQLVDSITLAAGDTIEVECVYDNSTDTPVAFGDSTREEMCYAAVYAYPALSDMIICSS